MKIIVASDTSQCSQIALDSVVETCWPDATEIQVLTVVELSPSLAVIDETKLEDAQNYVTATVEKLKGDLPLCQVTGSVLVGQPDQIILRTAESSAADLIVLGTHGRKGLSSLLLGSVSHSVLLHAKCAVRIIRQPSPKRAPDDIYKVLIATNDTFESDYALDHILNSPWPKNTHFLCVTVIPGEQEKASKEQEVQALSWLKCCVVRLNVKVADECATLELLSGDPKEAIMVKAIEWSPDLIVLGSRSRSLLGRIVRSSVSEAVATKAPCSVEVLPMSKNEVSYVLVES